MNTLIAKLLLIAVSSAIPESVIVLEHNDGSIETCHVAHYVIDGSTIYANGANCESETIFHSSFE